MAGASRAGAVLGDRPTRRRLDPEVRRGDIVAAASRLFAERPYDQVSTTELARAAGVARGLLNHYFGDKRGLYLEVVRRAALLPELERPARPRGTLAERIEAAVSWFLDSIEPHRSTYLTVRGRGGVGEDPEVAAILDAADDLAARRVLEAVGLDPDDDTDRAVVRAYGGLVRVAVREWTRGGTLTREQTHVLLRETLRAVVEDVLGAGGASPSGRASPSRS